MDRRIFLRGKLVVDFDGTPVIFPIGFARLI